MNSRDLTIQHTITLVPHLSTRVRAQVYLSCMLRSTTLLFRSDSIRLGLPRNYFPSNCFSHFIPQSVTPNSEEHSTLWHFKTLNWIELYNVGDVAIVRPRIILITASFRLIFPFENVAHVFFLFLYKCNKFLRSHPILMWIKSFKGDLLRHYLFKIRILLWNGNCINVYPGFIARSFILVDKVETWKNQVSRESYKRPGIKRLGRIKLHQSI